MNLLQRKGCGDILGKYDEKLDGVLITFAIANHKGGTGKTTGVCNIGSALAGGAVRNCRTLLIDLDAQETFRWHWYTESNQAYLWRTSREVSNWGGDRQNFRKLIHCPQCSRSCRGGKLSCPRSRVANWILKELLEPVKGDYDVCIIDCSPNLGLLTVNAFVASSKVLIPMQPEFFAAQGLTTIESVISKIQRRFNLPVEIGGVFVSRYNGRKILTQNVLASIEKHFSGYLFESKIRECVAIAEAPVVGQSVFQYAPKSSGAEDFAALSLEITKRFL